MHPTPAPLALQFQTTALAVISVQQAANVLLLSIQHRLPALLRPSHSATRLLAQTVLPSSQILVLGRLRHSVLSEPIKAQMYALRVQWGKNVWTGCQLLIVTVEKSDLLLIRHVVLANMTQSVQVLLVRSSARLPSILQMIDLRVLPVQLGKSVLTSCELRLTVLLASTLQVPPPAALCVL